MKKLLPYFKPYRVQSFLGPLFKLLEATFELLVPVIVGLIVDRGLGARLDGAYPNADKGFIFAMFGVLALFGVVGLACSVTAQYFAAKAATGVASDVRKALFKKLQSLSYADFDRLGTSTMLTRITGDINQFQSGINLFLRLLLRSPFIVFGAMIAAFLIDVKVALIFVAVIVALSVVVFGIMFLTMPLYKRSQERLDEVTLSVRENLSGARVIRAFCREDKERAIFNERNEALKKNRNFAGAVGAVMNPLTYALLNIAIIGLLKVGAIRVEGGSLSQGNVLALYNLMTQILVELVKLANLIVLIAKAAASANRVEQVFELESSLKTSSEQISEGVEKEEYIVFENVSVRYHEGGEEALSGVDFKVQKGETVGVIGGTGSGKTTLVNLLPHFYDVSAGSVRLAGKDVRAYNPKLLRERIGVVPQKAVLFKGTIRENLCWGKNDATDEELWAALKTAQAEKVVRDKGGLDSPVEQGGKNFSGGQKQRLTIARALVRKPEILILDDSSSALDYATDAALRRAIRERSGDTTVFIVSQRTSSVRNADKIVVLDDGKAVGIGTHAELLECCAVYKEIYDSQYKDDGEVGA
ncbi:MAG: ABC transporter ATP-binding protein [Clostridia bacterium]|nr:ABC transporter ATP-binding protein [Clostridia bacterium]